MLETAAGRDLQYEVERFLYREALLLDSRDLHAWLDLFTADAHYAVYFRETVQRRDPSSAGGAAPTTSELRLVEDDRSFLELRVKRLETRLAHAEQPPSFTRHLVTNVLVDDVDGVECTAHSNFLVHQARLDVAPQTFVGQREDRLRRVDGQWRVARRKVLLDTSVVPRTITIFF